MQLFRPLHRWAQVAMAAAILVLIHAGALGAQQQAGEAMSAELAAAKAALEKYKDPVMAVHDGYLSTVGCIDYPKGSQEGAMSYKAGAMGVHFLNLGYIGPTISPDKPQVLIYEPRGDKLELVAAEWFVPTQAVSGAVPSIFGRQLEGPMMGHKPIMPDGLHHYDLHVWLWKQNPNGIFHSTNPTVKCPKSPYTFVEDAPQMAPHGHKP